jgi:hypothetical protein
MVQLLHDKENLSLPTHHIYFSNALKLKIYLRLNMFIVLHSMDLAELILKIASEKQSKEQFILEVIFEDYERHTTSFPIYFQLPLGVDEVARLFYKGRLIKVSSIDHLYFILHMILPNILHEQMKNVGITVTNDFMLIHAVLHHGKSQLCHFQHSLGEINDLSMLSPELWDTEPSLKKIIETFKMTALLIINMIQSSI